MMIEYIQFVADRLIVMLGYEKHYRVENPFDFMQMLSLQGKTNFFEKKVSEYQKSSVLSKKKEDEFNLDADFWKFKYHYINLLIFAVFPAFFELSRSEHRAQPHWSFQRKAWVYACNRRGIKLQLWLSSHPLAIISALHLRVFWTFPHFLRTVS